MRFSVCLRLVQSVGFFWGSLFIPYNLVFMGYKHSVGFKKLWKQLIFCFLDGANWSFFLKKKTVIKTKLQALGCTLLYYNTPHIPIIYPWAWFILRQLKLRTYRGLRFRLGLPSRGQRTRSNAETVSRHSDLSVYLLRQLYWRQRLWQVRSKTSTLKTKQNRKTQKSKTKLVKKKGPAVRSKDKKKSVWR